MVRLLQGAGVALVGASAVTSIWNVYSRTKAKDMLKQAGHVNFDDGKRHSNLPTSNVDVIRSTVHSLRSPHLTRMLVASLILAVLARYIFPGRRHMFKNTVPSFFVIMWVLYYQFRVRENPRVRFQRTPFNVQIVEKSRLTRQQFRPIFWAFNGHVQTALCTVLNDWALQLQPNLEPVEERFPAWDGNDIILYWGVPSSNWSIDDASNPGQLPSDAPVVLLSHGITGGPQENYVKNMFSIAAARGWRPVLLYRWRLDFTDSRDLATALDVIKKRYPRAPIFAVGYSAGAHVLLSYLNAAGRNTPLVAAVVVGAAYNMIETLKIAKETSNRTYEFALTYALKQCVLRHVRNIKPQDRKVYDPLVSRLGEINDAMLIYDMFVELSGSRMSGMGELYTPGTIHLPLPRMRAREAHYSLAPGEHLSRVAVTTLVIHARDDPITPLASPYFQRVFDDMYSNPHIIVSLTKRGGHLGWHQGAFPSGPSWADEMAADFMSAILGNLSEVTFLLTVLRNVFGESIPSVKHTSSSVAKRPPLAGLSTEAVQAPHSEPAAVLPPRAGLELSHPDDDNLVMNKRIGSARDQGAVPAPAVLSRRMSQPIISPSDDDDDEEGPVSSSEASLLSPDRVAHIIAEAAAEAPRAPSVEISRVQSMPNILAAIGRVRTSANQSFAEHRRS